MKTGKNVLKIVPIFLLGSGPSLLNGNKIEQDAKADEIISRLGIDVGPKFVIRKEDELNEVDINDADAFIVFPYCAARFTSLIHVADSKLPIIIVGQGDAFDSGRWAYIEDPDGIWIELF